MVLLQRPFIAIETVGKNVADFVIGHKGNGGMTVIDHIFCGKIHAFFIIGGNIDEIGMLQLAVKGGDGAGGGIHQLCHVFAGGRIKNDDSVYIPVLQKGNDIRVF